MSWLPTLSPAAWLRAGAGLAVLLLLCWALRVDGLRAAHLAALTALRGETQEVVLAVREASGNPRARWDTAPEQIRALGSGVRALRLAIRQQNAAIDAQAAEAVRLRAHASELAQIASRAEAQRRTALAELRELARTPGANPETLAACQQLLGEAETALDLVREAGL